MRQQILCLLDREIADSNSSSFPTFVALLHGCPCRFDIEGCEILRGKTERVLLERHQPVNLMRDKKNTSGIRLLIPEGASLDRSNTDFV